MLDFEDTYEVCNCKKVTLKEIKDCISNNTDASLSDIQELTTAGTECRRCIFPEGDLGKIKKKIYCKQILNEYKKEING